MKTILLVFIAAIIMVFGIFFYTLINDLQTNTTQNSNTQNELQVNAN